MISRKGAVFLCSSNTGLYITAIIVHYRILLLKNLTCRRHRVIGNYFTTGESLITSRGSRALAFAALLLSLPPLLLLSGCGRQSFDFKTEYQAVFLTNGQAFVGKLEGAGTNYPLLRDVFYIQSGVNQETKQVTNVLVKRGKELHGPEFMYINARNILMIEPVASDSQVARLIRDAKAQQTEGAKK